MILTLKDEADSVPELLASIARQTWPPDEVVVVDGGSRDGTVPLLRGWEGVLPLVVVTLPGASIAEGRNAALERARGDIVAVTDGGVVLEPDWLQRLVAPFLAPLDQQPDVVSGFFVAAPESLFELALAVTTLPDVDEVRPERFLPSSRSVAFRRSWFRAGIRYPSWLDYCEDVVFDLRLRRAGARFRFEPGAVVRYRPRRSLGAYWHQYYRYARGDGKAGLFTTRHLVRYATYLGLVPGVALARDWRLGAVAALLAAAYVRRPLRRLWRRRHGLRVEEVLAAGLLIPLLRLVGDVAKMVGYPVGVAWRLRRYGIRRTWKTIPEEVTRSRAVGPAEGVPAGGTLPPKG